MSEAEALKESDRRLEITDELRPGDFDAGLTNETAKRIDAAISELLDRADELLVARHTIEIVEDAMFD